MITKFYSTALKFLSLLGDETSRIRDAVVSLITFLFLTRCVG